MPDDQESNVRTIEQADKLFSLVMSMVADWNSVTYVKAELIKEYAQDAIALFGKTNQEKKVKLRKVLDNCEERISPESFESFKKRAEKAFLRIVYPKNSTSRNILFVAILAIPLLSLIIPSLIKIKPYSSPPTNGSIANTNITVPPSPPLSTQENNMPAGPGGTGQIKEVKVNFTNDDDNKNEGDIIRIRILNARTGRAVSEQTSGPEEWPDGSSKDFSMKLTPPIPLTECDQLLLEVGKTQSSHSWITSLSMYAIDSTQQMIPLRMYKSRFKLNRNSTQPEVIGFSCKR